MDRNSYLLIAVAVFYVLLVGWLAAEVWWKGVPLTDAVFGTIIGALLAGLFGLIAALYAALNDKLARDRERSVSDVVILQGIVTKLFDLQDRFQKTYRHFFYIANETRVFFGENGEHSFSKPLEGFEKHVEFSIEERSFVLRKFGSGAFQKINDMLSVSENFSFLQKRHEETFYELMDEVAGGASREGYMLAGEISQDSLRLMKMMDVDGQLRSLLLRNQKDVKDCLEFLIAKLNDVSGSTLRYATIDVSPSAENNLRAEY